MDALKRPVAHSTPATSKISDGGATSYPYSRSATAKTSRSSVISRYTRRGSKSFVSAEDAQGQWRITIRPLLTMGLYFNVMIILCLLFLAIAAKMKSQYYAKRPFSALPPQNKRFQKATYQMHNSPNLAYFKEVSVVTTAVLCNDLARVLVVENYTIFAIAFAMQICLSIIEPHKSGLGGSSTVVWVNLTDKDSCHIIDTFDKLQYSVLHGGAGKYYVDECSYKFLTGKPINTVAVPGEIVVLAMLMKQIKAEELKRLTVFLKLYNLEARVITRSLSEVNRQYSPRLVVSKEFDWLFDAEDSYRPLDEGERYHHFSGILNSLTASKENSTSDDPFTRILHYMLKAMSKACPDKTSFLHDNAVRFVVEEWNKVHKSGWTKSGGRNFGDLALCMPAPFDEAIAEATIKTRRNKNEGAMARTILDNYDLIKSVYKYVESMERKEEKPSYNYVPKEKKEWNRTVEVENIPLEDIDTWHGNMFIIVSEKEKQAISYVGSLGSSFGSKISTEDEFYYNNFLPATKPGGSRNKLFRLTPAILFDSEKKKIVTALATPGGGPMHSMSLPRTISMLMMRKMHGTIPSVSVVQPLAFPVSGKGHLVYKKNVPYVLLEKASHPAIDILSSSRKPKKELYDYRCRACQNPMSHSNFHRDWLHRRFNVSEAPHNLKDEVIAVYEDEEQEGMVAFHLNHRRGLSYMPSGL